MKKTVVDRKEKIRGSVEDDFGIKSKMMEEEEEWMKKTRKFDDTLCVFLFEDCSGGNTALHCEMEEEGELGSTVESPNVVETSIVLVVGNNQPSVPRLNVEAIQVEN
ncbi:hypothetical protein KSP40_PGU000736 [Platanthera guangdongensis]|uniref:Uncharacterized protein n=1 Tax=Platanthera guangdongensis TaxID=2320717 RepID=A0ABR2MKG3_9ASPA